MIRRAVPVLALLVLAFGGYVKGLPMVSHLPGDITVAAAILVFLICAHRFISARFVPPRGWEYVVVLWSTFLLGWPALWLAYSVEKVWKIFTLTALCSIGSLFILTTAAARRMWAVGTVILGTVMAGLVYLAPNQDALASGRLAIEGGNTIGAGRGVGAAAVVLVALALSTRRHRLKLLALAVLLATITVGSGSRGPVLAAVIAIVIVATVSPNRGKVVKVLLSSVALLATGYFALQMNLVADRLVTTEGPSAEYRRYFWQEAVSLVPSHPFGIGWGQLYNYPAGKLAITSGEVQYPHNLLVEVVSEAGWLAGVALLVVLVVAFRRQCADANTPVEMAMLGLFVFYLVSAMVSGDISANRGVWVAVGAGLLMASHPGAAPVSLSPADGTAATGARKPGLRS